MVLCLYNAQQSFRCNLLLYSTQRNGVARTTNIYRALYGHSFHPIWSHHGLVFQCAAWCHSDPVRSEVKSITHESEQLASCAIAAHLASWQGYHWARTTQLSANFSPLVLNNVSICLVSELCTTEQKQTLKVNHYPISWLAERNTKQANHKVTCNKLHLCIEIVATGFCE